MTEKRKIALAAAGTALAAAALGGVYAASRPSASEGLKSITVNVTHKDGTTKTFSFASDDPYLEQALLDENLIEGDDSQYGLFVTSVDGESADYNTDGSWWKLLVNGEESTAGVSEVPVEEGTVYSWVYETD